MLRLVLPIAAALCLSDMVKARCSPSSSQPRPSCCPPLASLSLASTHRKHSKPTPFFSFLPFVLKGNHPALMSMDPPSPSSPSSLYSTEDHFSQASKDECGTVEELLNPRGDRRRTSTTVETESSSEEDAVSENEKQDSTACGRQRLQQHRIQMSGKVIIPDTWGREQQLQEWVSYGIVEDALRPAGLMSARTALVSECQHRENEPVRTSPTMSADVEVS